MTRLPQIGGDKGNWGEILNDFLSQSHNLDGSLKAASIPESALSNDLQAKINAAVSGTAPDASASTKGIVRLTGDLSGTADSPSVTAGAITNAHINASAAIAQSKIANLTSDLASKASTADLSTGLAAKANTAHSHTASQISDSTATGRSVLMATDAATARTAIGAGTSNLALGTTSTTAKAGDYTPTKVDVGLGNVDNTSDLNKPVSTAQAAAIAAVSPVTVYTLSRPGTLTTAAGTAKLPLLRSGTIQNIMLSLGATANADVIVDCNLNGTTVFANANNRPRVTAGQFVSTKTAVGITATAGQYLTIDVDQVGGPAPITFVGNSAGTNPVNQNNVSIVRPSGSQTGDLHVASIVTTVGGTVGSTTEPATVVTAPTNWVELGTPQRSAHKGTARDLEMHLYYWIDDGSNAGPFVFTATQPSSNAYIKGTVSAYRNALSVATHAKATPTISNSTWTAPSVTPSQVNSMLIVFLGMIDGTITGLTVPNMTAESGSSAVNVATADQLLSTTTATGAIAIAATTSNTPPVVSASVVLNPNVVPGGTGSDLTVAIEYQG